ncbi:MAG TPA: hypothetical protein VKQ06_13810, partial [Gammaproteobacteria bacterium]|nr:hypothetical protein [Gammaproteobacteria bacterium]
LQTLNREHGKTIVMVTHDPRAAEFATLRLSLDKGRLVTNGTDSLGVESSGAESLVGSAQ